MRTRVLGGLGALATLAAIAVVVRPDLVEALPVVGSVLTSQPPERLLLVLGLAVLAFAAWTARDGAPGSRAGPEPRGSPAARFSRTGDPPEAASAADRARTGGSFDDRVAAACSGDDVALREVRETLADTAAGALARADDSPPEQARRAVEAGAWTDDRLAAAFLAGDDGPGFSLGARLREWLDPAAERRRRVERAVEAVADALDDDGIGGAR